MGSAHILVAEDEPDIRSNLGRLLKLEGFAVSLASTGAEALRMVHAGLPHLPDLVVTDLMMPGMDGRQLLDALRADPRTAGVPVVLLTARADFSDSQDAALAGADACITKPYQRDRLLACIRGLLAPSGPPQL